MKKTIAIILSTVIVAAGVFAGGWFGAQYYYHKPATPPIEQSGSVIDDQGNDLTQGVHEMPRGMTFLAINTAGVTLTATVKPDDIDVPGIDWACRWANASAEWVTQNKANVMSYLTITPDAANPDRATIACFLPFGEQIILTGHAKSNPAIKFECAVDFAKRINDVTYTLTGINTGDKITVAEPEEGEKAFVPLDMDDAYTIAENIVWSSGTVTPEITKKSYKVSVAPAMRDYMAGLGYGMDDSHYTSDPAVIGTSDGFLQLYFESFMDNAAAYNAIVRYIRQAATPVLYVTMQLQTQYETVSEADTRCNLYIQSDDLAIIAESVTVDQGSVTL